MRSVCQPVRTRTRRRSRNFRARISRLMRGTRSRGQEELLASDESSLARRCEIPCIELLICSVILRAAVQKLAIQMNPRRSFGGGKDFAIDAVAPNSIGLR